MRPLFADVQSAVSTADLLRPEPSFEAAQATVTCHRQWSVAVTSGRGTS